VLLCCLVIFCVQGVTSYVIVRPLCTALALITSQFGAYSEGELTPNKAYPYLAMATNLSQVCSTAAQQASLLRRVVTVHSTAFGCSTTSYRARCATSPRTGQPPAELYFATACLLADQACSWSCWGLCICTVQPTCRIWVVNGIALLPVCVSWFRCGHCTAW
jgi:hypothetical protein